MNVLFVSMPFAAIRPTIGVSLLKSHLHKMGISARVLYLNMRFARRFGPGDYQYIAERTPTQSLAGDWIFGRCAFGARDDADNAYLRAFDERFSKFGPTSAGIAALRRARAAAEPFLQYCLNQGDWSQYDVIGFTSTFAQTTASLALAQRIKQRFPRTIIVFGGANCEAEMGLQLHRSFPFIDLVCSGEADLSFPRLMRAIIGGEDPGNIPGVISRREGRSCYVSLTPDRVEDMDTLPYPDYTDYFEQCASECPSYRPLSGVLVESSRGCWWGEKHHCTFCGLNGTSMAFRSKTAARVLDEITELCARYKCQFVEMVDNILDMHYFRDLVPELARRKLKLGLFYETKANLSREQLHALHDAGIHSIQPGIESFSTDILRRMRKGTSAAQNVQLLKWCKELGVKPFWNIIYGFPGENPTDYEETVKIIESITHLQPPFGFGAIRLDRFSPNFVSAGELGICNVRPDRSYGHIYDLRQEELSELAYYFEHDYTDGRDPVEYTHAAYTAVRRWQREPDQKGLLFADHGDTLAVWDFRSNAKRTLTILTGYERVAYLYCDQSRPLRQIQSFLADNGHAGARLEEFLNRLTSSRLMIQLDGRYLSLAVRSPGSQTHQLPSSPRKADAELVVL
ncbi:MAG TPA: RiPP maturation radical SAM C-methyltransferase [Bryobacteraceae bacterium]